MANDIMVKNPDTIENPCPDSAEGSLPLGQQSKGRGSNADDKIVIVDI